MAHPPRVRATIRLGQDVVRQLESLKEPLGLKTIEGVIRKLVAEHRRPRGSLFGTLKGMPEFKREEIDRFD